MGPDIPSCQPETGSIFGITRPYYNRGQNPRNAHFVCTLQHTTRFVWHKVTDVGQQSRFTGDLFDVFDSTANCLGILNRSTADVTWGRDGTWLVPPAASATDNSYG